MIGQTLRQYEILDTLGSGGMGEVYRAHDTNLDREVAIKVLPADLGADPERLARLEREARLLAAVSHPNVAAIHNLEFARGVRFLVLELVEGETLAQRLRSGPLPIPVALEICRQIACGLEAAHKQGIMHRDLKPSNVIAAADGRVKVLDFGLARELPVDATSGLTEASTLETLTSTGALLGTVPYMSPEQLRRQMLDRRTDVWSFGCVLYEALTGQRAFPGREMAEVLAAILEREPDWGALPRATPATAIALLRRCLRRDADHRLHDIADARIELEEALTTPDVEAVHAAGVEQRAGLGSRIARGAALVALGMLLTMLATLFLPGLGEIGAPGAPLHVPIALPQGLKPSLGYGPSLAISRDGQMLAYVLETGTTTTIYVKGMHELEARPVGGTEGARTPFFSPDGRWLAFFDNDDRKLKKVALGGGEPVVITGFDSQWGAAWGADETILFSSTYDGLVRVSASGGVPVPITAEASREHRWPALLPGGEVALITVRPARGSFDDASIAAIPVAGGPPQTILEAAYYPQYSETGHLIFVQGGKVLAVPFEPDSLTVQGPPVTVLDEVWTSSWTGYADFAFSETGTLIYISGGPDPNRATLVSVDSGRGVTPLVEQRRPYRVPRFSSDARQLALTIVDEQVDIWTFDLLLGTFNRVTDSRSWDAYPVWHPRMEELAFSSMREGRPAIYRKGLRTGEIVKVVDSGHPTYPSSWSSDGQRLAYWEENPETGLDIWVHSLETDSQQVFLRTPHNESGAQFSPDGRFVAYQSNETGQQLEVFVRPYPTANPGRRISTEGGVHPRWGAAGNQLFYRVGGKVMVADIDTEGDLVTGPPRILFEGPYGNGYDVGRDGQSFAMLQETVAGDPPLRINYIADWFAELRRRVAAGS